MSGLLTAVGELTAGLKQALPFMTGIVEANPEIGVEELLSLGRQLGLRYANAPARAIFNQLKNNVSLLSQYNLGSLNELPPEDMLGQAVSPLSKNYSYIVRITGYNSTVGAREVRHVTVVSDNALTPQDIFQTALSMPTRTPGSAVLENANLDIVGAVKSPLA